MKKLIRYKSIIKSKLLLNRIVSFAVILSTLFSISYYPNPITETQKAEGAYNGKQVKTVEYVLGGGAGTSAEQTGTSVNNSVNRASNVTVFAGNSWGTTKAAAGAKTVKIAGTGIRVVSAYLNFTASASSTAAVDVTDIELGLDINPGEAPNESMFIDNMVRGNIIYQDNSGLAGPNIHALADATGLLQIQNDSQFNSGLSIIGFVSVLGPTFNLMTLKLIVTYEQDYSSSAHTETKTVRFPLDSNVAGDIGSRTSACAAASTCQLTYNANLPDLNTNSDILDVWFEIVYTEDNTGAANAATTTIGINGGTAGVAHKITQATNAASHSNNNRFIIYRPAVGGADFASGTAQTLDVAVAGRDISALGGELVVTYNYSTGASSQTETISYWMNASTTLPTTATSSFSQDVVINNTGFSVKNAWYKIYLSPTATSTITASSTVVGSGASRVANYLYNQANPRNGEVILYHDLSQDASSFTTATTTVAGHIRQSTASGDSGTSVELFLTFTWTGSSGGPQTKTVKFYGGNSGTAPNSATLATTTLPFTVFLSETVPKTYLSAYLKTSVTHTDATAIGAGTVKILFQASSTVTISEATEDLEGYSLTAVIPATTTDFMSTTTIPWTQKQFTNAIIGNQAEEYMFSSEMVITYRADFGATPTANTLKTVRTIEYVLGGGAGTSAEQTGTSVNNSVNRASDADVFAGTAWNSTKGSAGTKTVKIAGTGIRVVSAYLNFTASASSTAAVDVTDIELGLDVSPGVYSGNMSYIDLPVRTNILVDNSGLAGPNIKILADATSLFQYQSDSQFNSGLSVVGLVSALGPTFNLMTLKLIVTYEQDYSSSAHTETKTVRFPLDSNVAGDIGSRTSACAAASTCQLTYNANLPDLNTNSDILDVWFEVVYTEDNTGAANAATTTIGINGGTAGVAHKITQATNAASHSNNNRFIIYRPAVGGADFASGTAQTLDVAVAGRDISALGGELVVTYNYSTGASSQTETISYWMNASTTLPTTATSSFSQDVVINNTGFSVKNAWYKIYLSPTATSTITASSTVVGSGASRVANYLYNQANPRNGEVILYHDLSQDASSFTTATTTVAGHIRQSTASGDSGTSVELFLTFTWTGSSGGPQTKTVKFLGGQSWGASNTAFTNQIFTFNTYLPELVKKTYLSAYMKLQISHNEATTIAIGNLSIRFAGNKATSTIVEATEDTEGYSLTAVLPATTTDFMSTTTIPWTVRSFYFMFRHGVSDEFYLNTELNVTYRVDFDVLSGLTQLHYRFINDDGNQDTASFLQSEDTAVTSGANKNKGDRIRLRFLISNTESQGAFNVQYRIEQASSTCTDWIAVPNSESNGTHWTMDLSQYVNNSSTTIDSSGLTNPVSKNFKDGYFMSSSNQTGLHNLLTNEFTEHEYSIRSTLSAETGLLYCFRLTNAGSTNGFTYSAEPQITLSSFNRNGGGAEYEGVGSGPIQTGGGQGGGTGTEGGGSGGGQGGGNQGGGSDVGLLRNKNYFVYDIDNLISPFRSVQFVINFQKFKN